MRLTQRNGFRLNCYLGIGFILFQRNVIYFTQDRVSLPEFDVPPMTLNLKVLACRRKRAWVAQVSSPQSWQYLLVAFISFYSVVQSNQYNCYSYIGQLINQVWNPKNEFNLASEQVLRIFLATQNRVVGEGFVDSHKKKKKTTIQTNYEKKLL